MEIFNKKVRFLNFTLHKINQESLAISDIFNEVKLLQILHFYHSPYRSQRRRAKRLNVST